MKGRSPDLKAFGNKYMLIESAQLTLVTGQCIDVVANRRQHTVHTLILNSSQCIKSDYQIDEVHDSEAARIHHERS